MSQSMRDYYELLHVSPDASPEQIRAAYRQRLKQNHPDMLKGLRERFKDEDDAVLQEVLAKSEREAGARTREINQAFQVLSDPLRRAQYDEQRATGTRAKASAPSSRPSSGSTGSAGRASRGNAPSQEDILAANEARRLLTLGHYKEAYLLSEKIAFQPLRREIQTLILEQASRRGAAAPRGQGEIACPQCHQVDQVSRVRDLVSAGSLGSWAITADLTVSSQRTMTQLLSLLNPNLGRRFLERAALVFSAPFAGLALLMLLAFPLVLDPVPQYRFPPTSSARAAAASDIPPGPSSVGAIQPIPAGYFTLLPADLTCLGGSVLAILLANYLPPVRQARLRRRWMRRRWEKSYYCAQCDAAFVAGESFGAAPQHFADLLKVGLR